MPMRKPAPGLSQTVWSVDRPLVNRLVDASRRSIRDRPTNPK